MEDRGGLFGGAPQPRERFTPGDIEDDQMICRQAGLFVADMRDRDPAAFAAFLDRLRECAFVDAFTASFGVAAPAAWKCFAAPLRASDAGPPP